MRRRKIDYHIRRVYYFKWKLVLVVYDLMFCCCHLTCGQLLLRFLSLNPELFSLVFFCVLCLSAVENTRIIYKSCSSCSNLHNVIIMYFFRTENWNYTFFEGLLLLLISDGRWVGNKYLTVCSKAKFLQKNPQHLQTQMTDDNSLRPNKTHGTNLIINSSAHW